jgi:hypothetical protein
MCPFCNRPTFFEGDQQIPGVPYGAEVSALPVNIEAIYNEARRSVASSSYTGAVMLCRKLLMNVAVDRGAPQNQSFAEYVNFIEAKGYIAPGNKGLGRAHSNAGQ